MTPFFLKLHKYFLSHKILLILLLLGVLFLGVFAFLNLKLEEDITNVLPENGELARFEKLISKTSNGNRLLFILKNKDQKSVENLSQSAEFLQNYFEEKLPDSLVNSISLIQDEEAFLDIMDQILMNLPVYLTNEDLASIPLDSVSLSKNIQQKLKSLFTPAGSLVKKSVTHDPLDLSNLALKKLQSLEIDDNFFVENACLISKDSTYLLGSIVIDEQIHHGKNKTFLYENVQDAINLVNAKNDAVEHFVFGAHLISEANAQRIKKDIMLTINIALTLLLIAMAFYFKTAKVLPGFIIPIFLGASVALFAQYLFGDFVSAISLGMGSVLLGTIVDYTLHLFTHLKKYGEGESAIKHASAPIMAGSITTSFAFLTLIFIKSKALTDLAIFAAFSMFFGAVFAILVLPIIYNKVFAHKLHTKNWVDNLAAYDFHKNKYLIVLALLLSISSLFFFKNINFTSDLNKLNFMPPLIAEAEEELKKASNVLQSSLLVIIESESIDKAIEETENLESFLLNEKIDISEIKSVSGLMSSNKTKQKRLDEWSTFWTDDKINLIENILKVEAKKLGVNQSAFNPFINQLKSPKITKEKYFPFLANSYLVESDEGKVYSTLILKTKKEHKAKLSQLLNSYSNPMNIIDRSSMVVELVEQVKNALSKISWLLLAIILIVLFFYFRQKEMVFLAFLPIFMSWLTTFGLMGFLNINFNLINILIVVFIFGLGIDYAIFILNALKTDYTYGEETLSVVKSSVFLSAFTSFVGIGVLFFAKHPAIHSIALAGVMAIFSVFFYAVIVLPFLFQQMVYNRVKNIFQPITFKGVYDTFLSYFSLVVGTFTLNMLSVFLRLLFFINIDKRKLFFHHCLYWFSNLYKRILFPKYRYKFFNESKEDFYTPSVIISNHQSIIDTTLILSLHPKIVMLTKDWVRKNPLFGLAASFGDFYSVEQEKPETLIQLLKEKSGKGFSIAVFPEGSRSENRNLRRFHRGALHIAEALNLDVLPVAIHGTIDTIHRNQFFGQRRHLALSVFERIKVNDAAYGADRLQKFKALREDYKALFYARRSEVQTGKYFDKILLSTFLYKDYKPYACAKKVMQKFNNFEQLKPYFLNKKQTIILDDSFGEVIIMQSLLYPEKKIDVFCKNKNFVQNHFLLSKNISFINDFDKIEKEKYEIIVYIGINDSKLDSFISDTKIYLNTNTFKLRINQ